MNTWTIWAILIIAAYLLGSVPASYLAGRLKGIDLRQLGTTQVGGGNLWRMTSWKLGLPVGVFDFSKGAVMVWIAQMQGLDVAQQITVGSAAIIGHNWPVFLRFHGGRGVGTTLGIFSILPFINDVAPWPSAAMWAILLIGRLALGSSPLAVLAGVIVAPLVSWRFQEPLAITMGFVAIFLIIVIKRLTAQPPIEATTIGPGHLLLNRFLFDRDIKDNKVWMYRKALAREKPREDC